MSDKYIRVYDNILSEAQCLHYISLIDKGERKAGKHVGINGVPISDPKVKLSEDITLCQVYPEELETLMRITAGIIDKYEQDVGTHIPVYQTEQFKGRVYRENAGHYKAHIDVAKPLTYGRMITIIYYLNTVPKGGELYFANQDVTVKAVQGRVVCFPPYWQYRHQAKTSLEGDRYIIRTFAKGP